MPAFKADLANGLPVAGQNFDNLKEDRWVSRMEVLE